MVACASDFHACSLCGFYSNNGGFRSGAADLHSFLIPFPVLLQLWP